MEISTEEVEIKSYEVPDPEPFHYIAALRNEYGWVFNSTHPYTDKEFLIQQIRTYWPNCKEVRILKVRLPIGR